MFRKFREGVALVVVLASVDFLAWSSARDRYRRQLWAELQRWKFDHWVAMGGVRHGPPPEVEPFEEWKRRLLG